MGYGLRLWLILTMSCFRTIGLETSSLTCPSCQRFLEVLHKFPHRGSFMVRCVWACASQEHSWFLYLTTLGLLGHSEMLNSHNIGALIIRTRFGVSYTMTITRNPKNPILIIQASTSDASAGALRSNHKP